MGGQRPPVTERAAFAQAARTAAAALAVHLPERAGAELLRIMAEALPETLAQPDEPPAGGAKWTPERIEAARTMRDKLRGEGWRDYMARTAKHFGGVSTARLRAVLGPDENRPKPLPLVGWPPAESRRVHRMKK